MTAQDVIDRARFFLNDADSSAFRWLDDELLPLVNDAVNQVTRIRPDALYNTSGALITVTDATDVSSTLSIDGKWLVACALYTAWAGLNKQSGEAFNANKVKSFMEQFSMLVKV